MDQIQKEECNVLYVDDEQNNLECFRESLQEEIQHHHSKLRSERSGNIKGPACPGYYYRTENA